MSSPREERREEEKTKRKMIVLSGQFCQEKLPHFPSSLFVGKTGGRETPKINVEEILICV